MTKRQLIDEIVSINQTAQPAFLARFQDQDLNEYLAHLRLAKQPRLTGDTSRYEQYFYNLPLIDGGPMPPTVEQVERRALLADLPCDQDDDCLDEQELQDHEEPAEQAQTGQLDLLTPAEATSNDDLSEQDDFEHEPAHSSAPAHYRQDDACQAVHAEIESDLDDEASQLEDASENDDSGLGYRNAPASPARVADLRSNAPTGGRAAWKSPARTSSPPARSGTEEPQEAWLF